MAEANGQHGEARLDRPEREMDFIPAEHERFREENRLLQNSIVSMQISLSSTQDVVSRTSVNLDRLTVHVDEIGGKLDALIHVVETDHRDFNERLKRLNG